MHSTLLALLLFATGSSLAQNALPENALRRLEGASYFARTNFGLAGLTPDGKTLLLDSGGLLELVDFATGKTVRQFTTPPTPQTMNTFDVSFSRDGKRAVVVSLSASTVWNVETGKALNVVNHGFAGVERNHRVAWTKDAKKFALCTVGTGNQANMSTIGIYETETGNLLQKIATEQGGSRAAYSSDETLLATWGMSTIRFTNEPLPIHVWDARTGKSVHKIESTKGKNWESCCFVPDQSLLAVVDVNGRICVIDPKTGKEEYVVSEGVGGNRAVYPKQIVLFFSTDGKNLIHANLSGTVDVWDFAQRKKIVQRKDIGQILQFVLPQGKILALIQTGQAYQVLDILTGNGLIPPRGHSAGVSALAFTPDGKELVSTSAVGEILWWDATTGKELRRRKIETHGPKLGMMPTMLRNFAATLSRDGQYWAGANFTPTERLVEANSDKVIATVDSVVGTRKVALSTDNKKFAVMDGRAISIVDLPTASTFKCDFKNAGTMTPFTSTSIGRPWSAVVRNGNIVAYSDLRFANGNYASFLRLHDMQRNEALVNVEFSGYLLPASLDFSPDERFLAVAANRLFLLDVATGAEIRKNDTFSQAGSALRFAPDGHSFAVAITTRPTMLSQTGSATGSIEIYETATLQRRAMFPVGHRGVIQALAYSHDGKVLASGGDDLTIFLWDLARPIDVTDRTLEQDWTDLAGSDPISAYKVIRRWSCDAEKALGFIKTKVQPTPRIDATAKQIEKLVADLSSQDFAARDSATKSLQKLGELAVPALQAAQAEGVDLETKKRTLRVLQQIQQCSLTADEIRSLRALEILERIANPASRTIVALLASGAPSPTTHAAKNALGRWKP